MVIETDARPRNDATRASVLTPVAELYGFSVVSRQNPKKNGINIDGRDEKFGPTLANEFIGY